MVCPHCGKEIDGTPKYCMFCGKRTVPSKKKTSVKKEKSEPGIILRILFMLCALILALHTLGTLAVGICGESTAATDIRLSFNKKEPNGGKNDYQWWLDYTYRVGGTVYSGYTMWHGTRWSPDSGSGKYHVNYLPFFPQISRFEKYRSLLHAQNAEDVLLGGGRTVLSTLVGFAATYLLIFLSFPAIPFFSFGKKRSKTKKPIKEDIL